MFTCSDLRRRKKVHTLEDYTENSIVIEPEKVAQVETRDTRDARYKIKGTVYSENDYEAMWNDVVKRELHMRALWRTFRTYPCKKVARVLPPSFPTWSAFLEGGGVIDKSTGKGSLSRSQKRFFWSDQCSCKCWGSAPEKAEPAKELTKIIRHDGVAYLETIEGARRLIEERKEEERIKIARIETFWKDLEESYRANVGKKAEDGQEMIDWYWSFPTKAEFVQIYNQRFKNE